MKILLVGGGSGGPVSPLIAVAGQIKKEHPRTEFLLVGTKTGPERQMAKKAGIPFISITSGKWRRYFSLKNFATPVQVAKGFLEARGVVAKFKPDCVFGTGSFVQVPIVWAAKLKKIPVVLHQQDVLPGLANRLCQYSADAITVTFPDTLVNFTSGLGLFYSKNKNKIILTGNPFRSDFKGVTKAQALQHYHLKSDLPVLLVLGGGTGSEYLNNLVWKSLPQLSKTVQILHSTGDNKEKNIKSENYQGYSFISDMGYAYAAADIVVCRAGLSTITELSNLRRVSIIIPMPGTHQELNAYLLHHEQAALVFDQGDLTAGGLVRVVRRLLFEPQLQESLKENISNVMLKGSAEKIAKIIIKFAGEKKKG